MQLCKNRSLHLWSYLIISSVQKNRVLIAVESLVTDQITPKLNENERSDRNIPPSPWDRSEIFTYATYNTRRSRISMVMHRKVLKNSDATWKGHTTIVESELLSSNLFCADWSPIQNITKYYEGEKYVFGRLNFRGKRNILHTWVPDEWLTRKVGKSPMIISLFSLSILLSSDSHRTVLLNNGSCFPGFC